MATFPAQIIVDKQDFEIFEFASGYFGICEMGKHGGNCVHGGDSANEDDYSRDSMEHTYEKWTGALHYNERYGYQISE